MSDSQKITTVKRDGWTVVIMFPTAVYDKYMGGIDLHDWDRKLYFCNRKCWHFCALATVDSPDSQLHRPVASDQGNSCTKSGEEHILQMLCATLNFAPTVLKIIIGSKYLNLLTLISPMDNKRNIS